MAGIDNLKERILNDDRSKSIEIQAEARLKAEETLQSARKKALELLEASKTRAEMDGKDQRERMISRAKLDRRNQCLSAKQEVISNVIELACEKIESMNKLEYSAFLERLLLENVETGDEEVVFSSKEEDRIDKDLLNRVNKALISKGKKGSLSISREAGDIASGFVLKRGGLEINCTIDARTRIIRDDIEKDLAELLFEGR